MNPKVTTPTMRKETMEHFAIVLNIAKRFKAGIIGVWPKDASVGEARETLEFIAADRRSFAGVKYSETEFFEKTRFLRRLIIMKFTLTLIFLCLLLSAFLGCARTYQSITAETFTQGQRVSISGVPQKPEFLDFVPPTPAHEGYWHVKVSDVNFIGYVNFENAPRIRAIRRMAEDAYEKNRKVTVAGKAKKGFVELESFNGIRVDTPWYKNSNPHYSYRYYYQWYPFAYEPNERAIHN